MCGGCLRSILLWPLVARFLETIDVYRCLFYVCCSDIVEVCGNVCCVAGGVEDVFSLGVLNY